MPNFRLAKQRLELAHHVPMPQNGDAPNAGFHRSGDASRKRTALAGAVATMQAQIKRPAALHRGKHFRRGLFLKGS
jgi:hypothetical protein